MTHYALGVINSPGRNTALDLFRAIAVLSVVLFHYDHLVPYGFLGVDLFFVLSGLLVGRALTQPFDEGKRIGLWKFFLKRGFKIWPSYYAFLLVGSLLATLLYRQSDPSQIIKPGEFPKYLFFYKNFAFEPVHQVFDHVWSLCVEEHFYLLLPLCLIAAQQRRCSRKNLLFLTILVIAAAFPLKLVSLYYTSSGDTSVKTHTRVDALAWGFLLNLMLTADASRLKKQARKLPLFFTGLALAIVIIAGDVWMQSVFFNKIILHTAMPLAFFLMILGLYHYPCRKLLFCRLLAYYSYNWYLWHALFIPFLIRKFGVNPVSVTAYLLLSFATAVLFTTIVEEPFLKLRKRWSTKYLNVKKRPLLWAELS